MGASIDPQGALLITNQIVSYWLLPLQPVFNSSKQSVFPIHASAVSRGEGWGSGVKSHIQIKVYYTYHSAGAHRASHFIIAGNQAGQTWFAFWGDYYGLCAPWSFHWLRWSWLAYSFPSPPSCLCWRLIVVSRSGPPALSVAWDDSYLNKSSFSNLLLLHCWLPHSFLNCAITGKGLGVGFGCEDKGRKKGTEFNSFFIYNYCHQGSSPQKPILLEFAFPISILTESALFQPVPINHLSSSWALTLWLWH